MSSVKTIVLVLDNEMEFALAEMKEQFDTSDDLSTVRAAINLAYMVITGDAQCFASKNNVVQGNDSSR